MFRPKVQDCFQNGALPITRFVDPVGQSFIDFSAGKRTCFFLGTGCQQNQAFALIAKAREGRRDGLVGWCLFSRSPAPLLVLNVSLLLLQQLRQRVVVQRRFAAFAQPKGWKTSNTGCGKRAQAFEPSSQVQGKPGVKQLGQRENEEYVLPLWPLGVRFDIVGGCHLVPGVS